MKTNLQKNLEFWVLLGASSFVLNKSNLVNVRLSGMYHLRIILRTTLLPPPKKDKIGFVESSFTELLESARIEQVSRKPVVVNPLSVSVQSNGKKRLLLDLRYVNHFIKRLRFKYDECFSYMFRKNGFMFSFDLKSGYHHVEIFQPRQKFLRFSWNFQSETRYYISTALPFGLSHTVDCFVTYYNRKIARYFSRF